MPALQIALTFANNLHPTLSLFGGEMGHNVGISSKNEQTILNQLFFSLIGEEVVSSTEPTTNAVGRADFCWPYRKGEWMDLFRRLILSLAAVFSQVSLSRVPSYVVVRVYRR
jgi:hypothetical protein